MGSNWPPYEVKMTFLRDWGGVFETKNPAWCAHRGPKVVCASSDKAFWDPFGTHFGRLWRLKRCQKMKSVSDILLGSKFDRKWWILVPNSHRLKMILYCKFWNPQSRFLNNSPCVFKDFRLLENILILGFGTKIWFNTNLETDSNLGAIWERFGYHTLAEIGVQIDSKPSLQANLFLEPFLNTLGGAGVEVTTPKTTF